MRQIVDTVLAQQTTGVEWIVLILQIAISTSSPRSRRFAQLETRRGLAGELLVVLLDEIGPVRFALRRRVR